MDKISLKELFDNTIDDKIQWERTSNPYSFSVNYKDTFYSITSSPKDFKNQKVKFEVWDDNGTPKEIDSTEDSDLLYQLFQIILKTNPDLKSNYNKFKKMENNNSSISLYKIIKRLNAQHQHINIIDSDYFYYGSSNEFRKYIEPPMKQLETIDGFTNYNEAEVILISAPGATGKTAMSNYLSLRLDTPIYDLGKHDAVGANSISGLLMHNIVEQNNVFAFSSGLKSGQYSMIIDGLDEASIRITQNSFEAFLKDVAFFAKGSQGLPFLILGRPAVMEEASMVLEGFDVKTTLLQIEPFTIEKAKDFIDSQVPSNAVSNYDKQYKDVRDYIIREIGGFFKNESEINHNVYERFIGYAPVLKSIISLFSKKQDYHSLLNDLEVNKKQKFDLLVDIVERILLREQKKIHEEVLPQVINNVNDENLIKSIEDKCGTIMEQCYRIVAYLVGDKAVYDIFDDSTRNDLYNDKMNEWIENHPFISKEKHWFENIVFESYTISKLFEKSSFKDIMLKGLGGMKKANSGSYLFADMFCTVTKTREIDYRIVPFIISSFYELDTPNRSSYVDILSDDDDDVENIHCELNLGYGKDEKEFELSFSISKRDYMTLSSPIKSMNIDAPINVKMDSSKLELIAPISIRCRSVYISSRDIILSNSSQDANIVIDSDTFTVQTDDGSISSITKYNDNEHPLRIFTNSTLTFPFVDYHEDASTVGFADKETFEKFQKFRRMMLMFRSHSKGVLARFCSKIDKRIGKTPMGKAIIDKLLKDKVLYKEGVMYYVDNDVFAKIIGVKYNDIRSCNINAKTKEFLKGINY